MSENISWIIHNKVCLSSKTQKFYVSGLPLDSEYYKLAHVMATDEKEYILSDIREHFILAACILIDKLKCTPEDAINYVEVVLKQRNVKISPIFLEDGKRIVKRYQIPVRLGIIGEGLGMHIFKDLIRLEFKHLPLSSSVHIFSDMESRKFNNEVIILLAEMGIKFYSHSREDDFIGAIDKLVIFHSDVYASQFNSLVEKAKILNMPIFIHDEKGMF
jgi:hypothetical protein